jgi:hypothetical protein
MACASEDISKIEEVFGYSTIKGYRNFPDKSDLK